MEERRTNQRPHQPINPTAGSPLGKFIKRQIDGREYVRQMNEKRERHGLPPMRPTSASGQ
jgi:hypothetical protein